MTASAPQPAPWRRGGMLASALAVVILLAAADDLDPRIRQAEADRLAAIERVRPAVVAIFDRAGQGGGSGVLIDADGYALTNFHVVQPCGPFMQCGLANGRLYDAVLVGLDPVGDVALIRLLPGEPDERFPFAPMGDSDQVRVGDWALAMGNPFLLATDFTPTITFGIVSGTHRYQYPAGTILEYTDCIQTEASINPGNSGGPLFNLRGEIIGINGRGSFEKRGRVNSGVGYAISINQIKNFLGHLRGGLIVDHATLGARVKTNEDGQLEVVQILENSDAYRRGLREGDILLSFAGRPLQTVNQFKNVLGIYPKGWRLPFAFRHFEADGKSSSRRTALVRLMGVMRRELDDDDRPKPATPPPGPQPRPRSPGQPEPAPPAEELPPDHPARKLYTRKPGFANHYFNVLERRRVWDDRAELYPADQTWEWAGEVVRPVKQPWELKLDERLVTLKLGEQEFSVEPLKSGETLVALSTPPGSGGLLVALHHWRRLLTLGEKGFEGGFSYGGVEPFYPDGAPTSMVLADVLLTEHVAVGCKWYFHRTDGRLLGMEATLDPDADPCEVVFGDYAEEGARARPRRIEVRYGDREYGVFNVTRSSD